MKRLLSVVIVMTLLSLLLWSCYHPEETVVSTEESSESISIPTEDPKKEAYSQSETETKEVVSTDSETQPSSSDEEPGSTPQQAVESFYLYEDVLLSLTYDGKEYPSYSLNEKDSATAEWLQSPIGYYKWIEVKERPEGTGRSVFTISSENGDLRMTFMEADGTSIIEYIYGEESRYWTADLKSFHDPSARKSIIPYIRYDYNYLEAKNMPERFYEGAGVEEAVHAYLEANFRVASEDDWKDLDPENGMVISESRILKSGIYKVAEDQKAVIGSVDYEYKYKNPQTRRLWSGDTDPESTLFEDWQTDGGYFFLLQLQEDGLWHCIQTGTGDLELP